jgi:hypothetical protein
MRRSGSIATAIFLVAALALPAGAADLHSDHVGTECPDGSVGVWHFVNNQTEGAAQGTITAIFDGNVVIVQLADKVLKNNQHFTITGGTVLEDASTNLPGMLVLSDFTCESKK